jgi:AcrR family transcriptional regulator
MPRPRTDIQPRIVHAARARFLAEGVDGASLRTIAADAGTNVGMVFYYFPTKDDLFLAVVEEFYARLLQDLSRTLTGDASVRERLKRTFVRLGSATEDELDVVRLVAREALLSSERFKKVLARAQRGHLALLGTTLLEGVQRGEIDGSVPLPLLIVSTLAMGGLPQMVRRATGGQPLFSALPPPEPLAEVSAELLFRAIAPRPPPPVAAPAGARPVTAPRRSTKTAVRARRRSHRSK